MSAATAATYLGYAAAVVSAAATMVSAEQQAQATKRAAEHNAQLAANEAALQQDLAKQEIAKGIADKERQQRQAARAMGQMRADMAAGGFEIDSGSNLSLLAESAAEHQYDSATIMSNAEQAAWQHQVAGINAGNNQEFYNWQKANATSGRGASLLSAGGTLLGGIADGIGTSGGSSGGGSTLSSFGPYASGYKFPAQTSSLALSKWK